MFDKKKEDNNGKMSTEQMIVALQEIDKKMNSVETDPTKYTELGARLYPLDDRGLTYATELSDLEEVSTVDRLETWSKFAPYVFIPDGILPEYAEYIQELINCVARPLEKDSMISIHKRNKTAYKRRRSLEFVHAVKQDVGIPATEKSVNTMLKGGK